MGFGINTSLGCEGTPDFQLAVDRLADPTLHFENKWQHEHPDQFQAANSLVSKCYSVNRTAPATDSWRVAGGLTDLTVPGAELPVLDSTLPNRQADGVCPSGTGASQTMPNTDGTGTVTVPGQNVTASPSSSESATSGSETSSSDSAETHTATTFRTTASGLLWTDEATAARLIVPRGKVAVF